MSEKITFLKEKVLSGARVKLEEAKCLLEVTDVETPFLFVSAYEIRRKFLGKNVELCAIANARSGACTENCAYCAQSSFHKAKIPVYPLLKADEIFKRAKRAREIGAGYFCIVTSGKKIKEGKDFQEILKAISKIRSKLKINVDASLGELTLKQAKALKNAGLLRYNHNLETAQSLYSKVCTTHTYSDRLKTIENIKKAGLELCSGGIFGMGESARQRLELLFALRDLSPHCIPINFLNPIQGTKFQNRKPLAPLEFLKIIAVARFLFPRQEIKACGGREANLRSLQPLLFLAGANSIIIGDYLTTKGNLPQYDLQMIRDMGLKIN